MNENKKMPASNTLINAEEADILSILFFVINEYLNQFLTNIDKRLMRKLLLFENSFRIIIYGVYQIIYVKL